MADESAKRSRKPCSNSPAISAQDHGLASNDWPRPCSTVVTARHDPDFDGATMEMRASSGGKYVSLTCTVKPLRSRSSMRCTWN